MKARRKTSGSALILMLLAISLFLLLGCGQQKAAPSNEGVKAAGSTQATPKNYANASELYADLAKLPEADLDKRLLEGAQKEKAVRVYTTLKEQIIDALKKEFERLYPGVKVEYISGKETDLTSRTLSEFRAGRFMVDILQFTPGLYPINKEYPFAKHFSIPILKDFPKSFYTDYWLSTTYNPIVTSYNTKMVKAGEAPKSWDELLDPKWKSKVAIDINPQQLVTALVVTRGPDKTREYMKKLIVDNDAQVRKGHSQIGDMVVAGEFPVAAEQMLYNVESKVKEGMPVDWVAMDPIPVNISAMAIVNKAPNPYAAMLFAKFYGTNKLAININAQEGRIPADPNLEPVFPRLKTFTAMYKDRFFAMSPENTGKYMDVVDPIIRDIVEGKLK